MVGLVLIILININRPQEEKGGETYSIAYKQIDINSADIPYYRTVTVKDYQSLSESFEKAKEIEEKERQAEMTKAIKKAQEAKRKLQEEAKRKLQEKQKTLPSRGGDTNTEKLTIYLSKYVDIDTSRYYVKLCIDNGKQYNIDPVWLLAVMKTESNYDKSVVSHAGAVGLMQILPSTARYLGVSPSELYEPSVSIKLAARYLDELRDQTGSMKMATIAYNQGIGNVKRGTYRTWYFHKVTDNYSKLKSSIR